jgi:hypothetical protein
MATTVAPRSGAAPAGRAISAGIKEFADDFRTQSGKLYDKLDQHIPPTNRVDVGEHALGAGEAERDIPGAPNVSQLFKNARIKGIQGALKADTETTAGVRPRCPPGRSSCSSRCPRSSARRC